MQNLFTVEEKQSCNVRGFDGKRQMNPIDVEAIQVTCLLSCYTTHCIMAVAGVIPGEQGKCASVLLQPCKR